VRISPDEGLSGVEEQRRGDLLEGKEREEERAKEDKPCPIFIRLLSNNLLFYFRER
jgi:hypothetical protein